ncbi:shTK domain protein [Ancylostoma duodenale]|uniref:ShTK domain protein n=1 Tax=Ancylostoma duodenale TaxID=51022 RepID=A0A0C2H7R9_9BILA|nr:shTK domain protein [Ancylostoma duodenale]
MEAALISLLLVFIYTTKAQLLSCTGGGTGPCIGGRCPGALTTCINTAAGEVCCENSKIVVPTTAAPTTTAATTTAAPCVDKVNPRTGRSDCPNVAYLCNNSIYYTLMTEQCPKTCNRCSGATAAPTAAPPTASTCQDLVDFKTGVSNCPQVAYLCRNPLYLTLMQQQCRKTCGYCV